jgi:outer membrane protein OmpA-like peptidoglycan-associated protein
MEFQADGTEKYLTIGNFAKQDEVLTQKMRRPREFSSPQIRGSYYYVDNVSVIASSHLEEACSCIEEEEDPNDRLQVVYTKNVSENMDMDVAKQIELNKVFFENGRYNLDTKQKGTLAKLASILKENTDERVEIQGHADPTESEMYSFDIAEKRAQSVKDYLVSQGISADRLTAVGFGSENISASGGTSQAKAQNRRVEFITLD